MSQPVHALNLFDVSNKDEYMAYSRRSAKEVQAHGGPGDRARKVPFVCDRQFRASNRVDPRRVGVAGSLRQLQQ